MTTEMADSTADMIAASLALIIANASDPYPDQYNIYDRVYAIANELGMPAEVERKANAYIQNNHR
jgi:transcription initiation factor TFIIIB Brf1 subunit/transcription initiation factor TFIIB